MNQLSGIVADIGATNARFGLVRDGQLVNIQVLPCAEFPSLTDAALSYLSRQDAGVPQKGAFAIAAPLDGGDAVSMVNHPWSFSVADVRRRLGLSALAVFNDFEALARAVPGLAAGDYYDMIPVAAEKDRAIAIIGPGTGLGVAGVAFDRDGAPIILPTEGGHVTMPAMTPREFALFEYLKKTKYHHVSAERVVSGKGLVNLYQAIAGVDGENPGERSAADITRAAQDGSCPVCVEALDLFCHFLGVAAGNLALTFGSFGGLYIAGGIVPKLGEDYFRRSRFYESFLAKGRFKDYLARVPVRVITHPFPGMEGLRRAV